MSECKFIDNLNRLRKSSSDSIDNVDSFDSFKEYMHVVRNAEEDLKVILREVNASSKKTLILLCGSAGDGKSHLLSYLRNSDPEKLLDDYIVYNDATESNAPDKTAIETLYEVLSGFKDENLNNEGKNIILAINLGVLSNFIESEYASQFTVLKDYVFRSNILSSKVNENGYDPNSAFQYISFSDYHMFLLGKDGLNPEYIEALFMKVANNRDGNPFYDSYNTDCRACPLSAKCPVKKNYEYFADNRVREYIASLLVNVIVVPRLIEEKITEFLMHFRYIFDDINNKTLKINLINMGDCSEVFTGIAQYFIHSINKNPDVDQLIKFEIHIYSDKKLDNAFSNIREYGLLKQYLNEQKLEIASGVSMNTLEGIFSKNVECYFHEDSGKEYKYAHLSFYEMESEITSEQQERGIRPGTTPIALVAGLGKACEIAEAEYKENYASLTAIKNVVNDLIEKSGLDYKVNGTQEFCMPNTINVSFVGVESEALMLSSKQYCGISNGSACTSHDYSPSYVLKAMGLDEDRLSEAIRISWGSKTDIGDIKTELKELINVARGLAG